ncbi:dicarboxylate/amino acid:cation symporter [Cellulomonas carbonis]|uniref:Sodium:proton antiporter n=1 Tax=Cellulomonas carbonis T26 TaxID=947969 RepID=A0A0A0BLQ5_9CELL|nr:dicarboxylate/amino acid:cation symporter [Cellulomonas carbonis]KGM08770.1 sodium:proton antiporter [Cellulomonas carbonis T26]GGB99665.1 sodium:proton antiporter [Cellulomonas carbonis]
MTAPSSAAPSSDAPTGQTPRTRSRLRLPSFGVQVLLALVLGVALGLLARSIADPAPDQADALTVTLATIGSTFVTLLKALVPPLIVTAIIASIANLRAVTDAARLAGRTLLWFGITALASVLVGITLGLVFRPGLSTTLTTADAAEPSRTGSWLDFITGLLPANWLGVTAGTSLQQADGAVTGATTSLSFNALQLVVIALVVGVAALKVGPAAEPFLTFNRSVLAVVQKVLWWVIRLAPLGTVGLLGNAVATYGWDLLGPLASFVAAVYVGLAVVLFVLYPVLLRTHGLSPVRWFAGAWPAIQLAFVSRSSLGTLPLTERVTVRNLGVPREYASFAVPFGATTKMDGCAAVYPAIAAIFVAQVFGVQLSLWDYVLIAFVSVVGSAATAGLTGALVMLTLTLSTLGLPLAGVGLLLAVDSILDMGRTAVNVAGQTLVPTIVARRAGILDVERFASSNAADPFADDDAPVAADERERVAVTA